MHVEPLLLRLDGLARADNVLGAAVRGVGLPENDQDESREASTQAIRSACMHALTRTGLVGDEPLDIDVRRSPEGCPIATMSRRLVLPRAEPGRIELLVSASRGSGVVAAVCLVTHAGTRALGRRAPTPGPRVIGVGIDLVAWRDSERLFRGCDLSILERMFTTNELRQVLSHREVESRLRELTVVFAAKEAAFKATAPALMGNRLLRLPGMEYDALGFREIEALMSRSHYPVVRAFGRTGKAVRGAGVTRISAAILPFANHCCTLALACG